MASGDQIDWPDVAARVATVAITANSSTWTTTETPTALATATASLVSGWSYRITAYIVVGSSVAADTAFIRIREDTTAGTQIGAGMVNVVTTIGNGWPVTIITEYAAVATGSKSFCLTGQRISGTGNNQILAGAARPSWFTIDRIVS